ncbi:MAG: DUF202 domain-containing protein [Lachnospiraceae bacterium]
MKTNAFQAYKGNKPEVNLNDYLAMERTHLSVERTHLSYMRTVISMIVAAITLYKILSGIEGIVVAVILMVSALVFYLRGQKVCKEVRRNLKEIEDEDD